MCHLTLYVTRNLYVHGRCYYLNNNYAMTDANANEKTLIAVLGIIN